MAIRIDEPVATHDVDMLQPVMPCTTGGLRPGDEPAHCRATRAGHGRRRLDGPARVAHGRRHGNAEAGGRGRHQAGDVARRDTRAPSMRNPGAGGKPGTVKRATDHGGSAFGRRAKPFRFTRALFVGRSRGRDARAGALFYHLRRVGDRPGAAASRFPLRAARSGRPRRVLAARRPLRRIAGLVTLTPSLLLRLLLVFLFFLGDFALPLFERVVDLGQCAGPFVGGKLDVRARTVP